jgi:hypothetical protein
MRTLFVWAGGLALYYSSSTGKIGERWDNYSYFQAIGFAVLAAGTVVYGRGDDLEATRQVLLNTRPIFHAPRPVVHGAVSLCCSSRVVRALLDAALPSAGCKPAWPVWHQAPLR